MSKQPKPRPLLVDAVRDGDLKLVKKLLDQGYNVDETDVNKMTPLHYAAENGEYDMVLLLVENGANVLKKDKSKETPLDLASDPVIKKYLQMVVRAQEAFAPKATIYKPKITFIQGRKARGLSRTEYDRKSDRPNTSPEALKHALELKAPGRMADVDRNIWRASRAKQATQEYSRLPLREPEEYVIGLPISEENSPANSPRVSRGSAGRRPALKSILKKNVPRGIPPSLANLFI